MKLQYKHIPIYYEEHGSGNAVVLLHGFLETASMWTDLVPELSKTHQVITIDLLGHGKTGCLAETHTMEMMAQAVVFVLDHLQIRTAHFIGHSMGGYVALALAESSKIQVKGLCLLNSTPFADSTERRDLRSRAIRVVKQNPKSFISMSISNLFHPDNGLDHKKAIAILKSEAMAMSSQGIIAAIKGMMIRKDRSRVLQELPGPKLVVLGKDDPILDYKDLKLQLQSLNLNTIGLAGGHMSFIEDKEELSYILKQFIE